MNNSNWNYSGVGHLGVDLQRRDPRSDVEGVLVHHRLEAVVGGHRGQRGVVGRGDGAVHGCRGAVVRQLQVHAVGTGQPCSRDPWSASSAARRCCSRAQPPARPWWPGLLPWPEPRLPAPVRCCL